MNIERFKSVHAPKRQLGFFTEDEIKDFSLVFPTEVVEFLKSEGKATFNNDFFWTDLPHKYNDVLSQWGLDSDNCFVFLRTSLGHLIFYSNGEYFALNPLIGEKIEFNDLFDLMINNYLVSTMILEGDFSIDLHKKIRNSLPQLQEDEVYALNPTIPEGGSLEESRSEVTKLKEYLKKLADLHDNTTTTIE